jgi:8-oxo-dGTP diphosphatase
MREGVDSIGVAVAFYCHDGNGKLLLIKRGAKTRDEHGKWEIGGGAVEWGETQEDSLRREIREEYKTIALHFELLGVIDDIRDKDGEKIHWLVANYLVQVDPKLVAIGEPHKFTDIGWFDLNNLPQPLHINLELGLKRYREKLETVLQK